MEMERKLIPKITRRKFLGVRKRPSGRWAAEIKEITLLPEAEAMAGDFRHVRPKKLAAMVYDNAILLQYFYADKMRKQASTIMQISYYIIIPMNRKLQVIGK